jgi:hypothetical protein
MSSDIRKHFEELVIHKAKRMKQRQSYRTYRQNLLKEFNVTQPEEAFLLGAFDGMIYDMAGAIGQAFMKPEFRKNLLRRIHRET